MAVADDAKAAQDAAVAAQAAAEESKAASDAAKAEFEARTAELQEQIDELRAAGSSGGKHAAAADPENPDGLTFIERLVLADGISLVQDFRGKKHKRYQRGDLAKVRSDKVEGLENLYAIAKADYKPSLGYPTVLQQVLQNNKITESVQPRIVDTGLVADDGGVGSSDVTVPENEKQAQEQNLQNA